MAKRTKDEFTRDWIIENSVEILSRYEPGVLTIRALHYQLVSIGMTNTLQHYKRVVSAMEVARWDGRVDFEAFSDRDRAMCGQTKAEPTDLEEKQDEAKAQVRACKGYPSLTFLFELSERLREAQANGKQCVILYFGDYDPSGEDIPRSIGENLEKFGIFGVEIRRIALMEQQVIEWNLPPAPAKETDSRTANWDGLGQVELDAVKPEKLISLLDDAINEIFDRELYDELLKIESDEREQFQTELKRYVEYDL